MLLPVLVSAWYLWGRAADQYASYMGFTVRQEDAASATDLLGGLTALTSGGGSKDTDILYEFIESRELVSEIDRALDLRAVYARPVERDPVFAFDPGGSVEDLVDYWRRMVRIDYDSNSGLMELRVLAFAPADAQAIGTRILEESSRLINELSVSAREDATRYARQDLDQAVERLKEAREAVTAFRSRHQIADLETDIQSQMGVLATLQQQLAEALIELDLLEDTSQPGDPRRAQLERRIAVIEERIADERTKFGPSIGGTARGEDYATLIGEFERLTVDREFAEQSYIAALAAFDAARAEAQRQSRYLATFVRPTLAESAEYPQRAVILGIVTLFCLMGWSILALIYYSLRDRR